MLSLAKLKLTSSISRVVAIIILFSYCGFARYHANSMLPVKSVWVATTNQMSSSAWPWNSERMGDGCKHVYLDLGANIGVHNRLDRRGVF